jgi:hypothetical protein
MKKESIILNIYPLNKNSLILVSFDELKFPSDTDFGSIQVLDNNNNRLLFDLIDIKNSVKKFSYKENTKENHLAMIINRDNVKYIRVQYSLGSRLVKKVNPRKTISMEDDKNLVLSTANTSIKFEKKGYSIEKINIKNQEYGPLHLAASGGAIFSQKDAEQVKFSIISDSNILKIIKIEGKLKVEGDMSKKQGYLPFEMKYFFWSSDAKNMMSKVEIELKYDQATDLDGNKAGYLDPSLWYRLENFNKKLFANSSIINKTDKSKIATLKQPFYSYFNDNKAMFALCPHLALPNDGIHIEKGENFFGASWHSMSNPGKPYWAADKIEITGKPQGFFPAHSLRAYWKMGIYFGEKNNIEDIARVFSYPPKIRSILHLSSEEVSNAYITRWKGNKKMALNAITDDAKINDYLYRAKGKIPRWVQIAISTRNKFNINYHRFCFIGDKIFYIKKAPFLSTILSTLFCLVGIGKPLREKFNKENLSYLLHTNSHPMLYKLDSSSIKDEIKKSESTWINKWMNKVPLSHVISWTSPYSIPGKNTTKEKTIFSASNSVEWIREWPIPNAPLDFFLPTKLFWGVCVGELFDKENYKKIKEEFIQRYKNSSDYMQISGHVPEYGIECPGYITETLRFFDKYNDVWFADADEIIRYYKARENMTLSRVKKQGNKFLIEIKNKLPKHLSTEITLIQHTDIKINKMQFTIDNKNYFDLKYTLIGKNTIIYDVPSDAKSILIS